MATAPQLRKEFTDYLDSKGCKYILIDEDKNIVRLAFAASRNLDNGVRTRVYVDFDEEPDSDGLMCVHFVAQDCAKCNDEKVPEVLVRLNDMNKRFRWAKFWFDSSDNTITADADAIIFEGTTGEECLRYVIHVSNVVERALMEMRDIVIIDGDDGKPSMDDLLAMIASLQGVLEED